mmetsp:Transcript_106731/g.340737  ORF Transcript_106731/g.340737 Transcript_106731/m.340737 type:complete len:359 (+) Transcript_106731:834-1910(+)
MCSRSQRRLCRRLHLVLLLLNGGGGGVRFRGRWFLRHIFCRDSASRSCGGRSNIGSNGRGRRWRPSEPRWCQGGAGFAAGAEQRGLALEGHDAGLLLHHGDRGLEVDAEGGGRGDDLRVQRAELVAHREGLRGGSSRGVVQEEALLPPHAMLQERPQHLGVQRGVGRRAAPEELGEHRHGRQNPEDGAPGADPSLHPSASWQLCSHAPVAQSAAVQDSDSTASKGLEPGAQHGLQRIGRRARPCHGDSPTAPLRRAREPLEGRREEALESVAEALHGGLNRSSCVGAFTAGLSRCSSYVLAEGRGLLLQCGQHRGGGLAARRAPKLLEARAHLHAAAPARGARGVRLRCPQPPTTTPV